MRKKTKEKLLAWLTVLILAVGTFFTFYKNNDLGIDFQGKVIGALGNPFLVCFIIVMVLLCIAQLVKLIFPAKKIAQWISQKALFWLSGVAGLFIGYMFMNNAGVNMIQQIYGRAVLVVLVGLLLLFWYPKSKIRKNIPVKVIAILVVLVLVLTPLLRTQLANMELSHDPVVYLVEDDYQIVWHTTQPSVGWLTIGDTVYADTVGGALRSKTQVHKIVVPRNVLDTEKTYTLHTQAVTVEAYFAFYGTQINKTYTFRPMDLSDGIQIYNLSDNHNSVHPAAETASYWGDQLDLLILNGDIANDLQKEEDLLHLLSLPAAVTKGERPVLYARGNHETRGLYAQEMSNYVGCVSPDQYYFTTKIGGLWIMLLDVAEDKADSHAEYGGLARYEAYREQETAFIEQVLDNSKMEYAASDVEYRLLVSHIRVTNNYKWHQKLHAQWSEYANEIGLDLQLSGHSHRLAYMPPAGFSEYNPDSRSNEYDNASYAHNYPTVMGSKPPNETDGRYIATAVEFRDGEMEVWFTDQDNQIVEHFGS